MKKCKYHDEYLREDEYDIFHGDEDAEKRDLDIIRIKLPNLERWYSEQLGREVSRDEALTFVDGYGKPPLEQRFERQVMPEKVKTLTDIVFRKKRENPAERAKFKDITDVEDKHLYEELNENQKTYKLEIEWIKKQIKRRYVGYWCFIKGKPTYINGAFYFFLNFWRINNQGKNGNRADYRDYQRMMFNMLMYAYTTKDAFFKHRIIYLKDGVPTEEFRNTDLIDIVEELKEKGYEPLIEPDWNRMVTTDKRTCHGVNLVSGRRVAKTAISCCFCTWGTLNMPEQTFVIQAMNEDQAVNKIFNKQIQIPVSNLPFFFRPQYKGKLEASNGLKFQYEGTMAALARAGVVPEQMNCFITPGASSEKAFDGEAEIAFVYRDEPAKKADSKAPDQNIPVWWNNTMKPAIERGENIRGFCIMPSTVGDMDTGGGSQFLEIANDSHFSDRNNNGNTRSGLFNFFIPGYYAVEGYIDSYGYSIIEDPEQPVLTNEGTYQTKGAKTYLKNKALAYEKRGDYKNLIKLQQNFPGTWAEAFAAIPTDIGLPIEKMRDRLKDIKFLRPQLTIRGNFKWAGGQFGGEVEWENDKNGDWKMAYLPPRHLRNKRTVVSPDEGYVPPKKGNVIYAPDGAVANKFFLALDPIKFNRHNVSGGRASKPSAAVFYKQDSFVDMVEGRWKPREEWVSNDWTMYYLKQIKSKDEYHEEWLKCAIFHGAYVYPEWPDGEGITEYFREHGFDGYLLRDMMSDGKVSPRPGVWASAETINEMIGDVMTYFENNVKHVKIWEIIEQWTQMRGANDLTNHDLCASSGWCLRAIRSSLPEMHKEFREVIEIECDFPSWEV